MASKTTAFAQALLEHLFKNTALADVGDAAGLQPSGVAGVFYISLHTSDPGVGGSQNTNETNYGNYGRVSVARNGTNWDVTANVASNLLAITFPQCNGGSSTISHVGIGSDSSGAGHLFFRQQLNANLNVSNLITPEFQAGAITITET